MNEELTKRIEVLEEFVKSLESSNSIPLSIDQSFRDRFFSSSNIVSSSKSATSENQAVNEAGAATYSVLGVPDAFIQVTIGATLYYIPVFI